MTQIKVNNRVHTVDADEDMPLLWLLRDHLKLNGTKYGCGQGLCGACTVHVNGQPVRSCQIRLGQLANKDITTIEGLADNQLHPLQQAWLEIDVPQCGFCQPGQLMSASALLAKNPKPSDSAIDKALSGNICRCGTYNRIKAAVHLAAKRISNEEIRIDKKQSV